MAEMMNKTEASIYLLGYEDRGYIDKLLKAKVLGMRKLPLIKTNKIIYKKDLDDLICKCPLLEGLTKKSCC